MATAKWLAQTQRLITKLQNLNDAYWATQQLPGDSREQPLDRGIGQGRFTTYDIWAKTNLPIFKLKESTVRRKYSDFEWLRSELEREQEQGCIYKLTGHPLTQNERCLHMFLQDKIVDKSYTPSKIRHA
uniref:PX domain-containing protein n=1 Tax=Peromyscus maniculatus bairdii TaxID=230844 RepID=A0A8C8U8K6_PERMB